MKTKNSPPLTTKDGECLFELSQGDAVDNYSRDRYIPGHYRDLILIVKLFYLL